MEKKGHQYLAAMQQATRISESNQKKPKRK